MLETDIPHSRFMVAESMAYALSQQGDVDQGVRIYEELLQRKELSESDKWRFRSNIAAIPSKR